ncbi:MAG: PhoX family phosphatase [Bdellovibrionales bacterium]
MNSPDTRSTAVLAAELSRREFLNFMGRSALAAGALAVLPGCTTLTGSASREVDLPFSPLQPSPADALIFAPGFHYEILLRWGQSLNAHGDKFGFNNDYLAYVPLTPGQPLEGLLWVNHEYHDPFHNSGWKPGEGRTLEQVNGERKEVGGSIVHLRCTDGRWQMVENSRYNTRLDAFTPIPLIADRPIQGRRMAVGTFANCAGGMTPWGTVLTCEENYHYFVGEVEYSDGRRRHKEVPNYLSWGNLVDLPPEHYGWVVEVDLRTAKAKKLTALGRFSHECATTILASDGRVVVYSGDDAEQEHLYKFISAKPGSLERGSLYVADLAKGRWLPLNQAKDPRLKKVFKDQTDLLIRTREAAKIVGATPLDRPEDIEIDKATGAVIVSLTNSKKTGNKFGSLLRLDEENRDPLSLRFESRQFLAGGPVTGFACPDNLAFDARGNLWMTTDMSGKVMNSPPYESFANNGLFFIPMAGKDAGRAFQVASAPIGAELTGPCFAPDGRTLFLSVQHPGEHAFEDESKSSHWPDGGTARPAPCVVAVQGPALERLLMGV